MYGKHWVCQYKRSSEPGKTKTTLDVKRICRDQSCWNITQMGTSLNEIDLFKSYWRHNPEINYVLAFVFALQQSKQNFFGQSAVSKLGRVYRLLYVFPRLPCLRVFPRLPCLRVFLRLPCLHGFPRLARITTLDLFKVFPRLALVTRITAFVTVTRPIVIGLSPPFPSKWPVLLDCD